MSAPTILIKVVHNQRGVVFQGEFDGPVEIGRAKSPRERLYERVQSGEVTRVAIAECLERSLSRKHLRVEPAGLERVRLANLSEKNAVILADGTSLDPKSTRDIPLPAAVTLHDRDVVLEWPHDDAAGLQSLADRTLSPGTMAAFTQMLPSTRPTSADSAESLVIWLQAISAVLHSAVTSEEFFHKATQAMVSLMGLDSGRIFMRHGDQWDTVAKWMGPGTMSDSDWRASRRILDRLVAEKKTVWHSPVSNVVNAELSLATVHAVVAAPILDRDQKVIGAVYGDRLHRPGESDSGITKADAILVETLAIGVAAGLARLQQEEAALKARVLFEQFFSRELALQLESNHEMLDGRDADVTVLFCDVRHFSRISEKLEPSRTVAWINDTLGVLSESVLEHGGVLVDYVGDELMAMWGAPQEQPDHATLACRAALDMLARLPALQARWQEQLGEPMDLGIGVNSGRARVGNVGSVRKFKYGPLGNTNNLASRIQGATKYFGSNILISGGTLALLDAGFATRRVCRVQVVNIRQPVELFELAPPTRPDWKRLTSEYEAGLAAFEAGKFTEAVATLGRLLGDFPGDGPALALMARVMEARHKPSDEFDSIWTLPGK